MSLELNTLLDDLIKSNAALQSFALIVSYDLQEPLNRITSLSNKLSFKYGSKLDEQGQGYIKSIEKTSREMRGLLDTLFKYSTLTNQAINFESISLGKVFDKVLDEVKNKLKDNNVQIQIIGNPPVIEADPVLIAELIKTLILNAIRFRYPNQALVIKIEISTSNDLVKIEVADNGIGFSSDDADAIFQQFKKYNKADEYNGIAIGLSFCKIICDKHSG